MLSYKFCICCFEWTASLAALRLAFLQLMKSFTGEFECALILEMRFFWKDVMSYLVNTTDVISGSLDSSNLMFYCKLFKLCWSRSTRMRLKPFCARKLA